MIINALNAPISSISPYIPENTYATASNVAITIASNFYAEFKSSFYSLFF